MIRIFMIDDHEVFRCGLKAFLASEPDIEICGESGDGAAALKAMEGEAADVVLLDVTLPGMSGFRTAEELLARNPETRIIVLTMHEDEHCFQEFLRLGVKGFVLKKSSGTDLVAAIRAVYRGGDYVDPSMSRFMIHSYIGGGKQSSRPRGRLGELSPREKEVLRLLALGHTSGEAAGVLGISVRTVESHRASIMDKLSLKSRMELVRFAVDNGFMKL
jgi:DNA-binding NarL/FixJ family response regulator